MGKLYNMSAIVDLILHKGYKTVLGAVPIITIIEWTKRNI
jgi:hypothetical protein